jgi:O-Antigen ligase
VTSANPAPPADGPAQDRRHTGLGEARHALSDSSLVPLGLVFALLVWFAVRDGGFSATTWYPGAVLLAVLAVLAVVLGGRDRWISKEAAAATAALAAFTAWCYLSISWSDVQDDAWDGANRTFLYLAVFTLVAVLPWRTETMFALLGVYAVAVASIGVVQLSRAASAEETTDYFQFGRLASPLVYQNGNCALFLMAFWPALFLFSRRSAPVLARAVSAGATVALLELALLTQSRASLIAAPVTFALYLLLVPGRLRTLAFAAVPAAFLAATYRPLLDVFAAARDERVPGESLLDARTTLLVSVVFGILVGCAFALADRRLSIPFRVRRAVARAVLVTALAATALAVVLVASADPVARVDRAWTSFTTTRTIPGEGNNFSTGLSGTRYDLWRVALQEVRDEPILGVGVDNFAVDYLRERRSIDEPSYPHSLLLRIAAQTGVIGVLLMTAFVAFLALVFVRTRGTLDRNARELHGLALVVAGYWLVHGSVDWFWELPVLGGLAFVCFGIAARAGGARSEQTKMLAKPRLASPAAVVLLVAALLTLVPPWLAAEQTARAASTWRAGPADAFERLGDARALNPLADEPDLIAGAIASRIGDLPRMERSFRRALDRNPLNWYAHLELAIAEALQDEPGSARLHLSRARELNPREHAITVVQGDLDEGRKPSPAEIDKLFLERVRTVR